MEPRSNLAFVALKALLNAARRAADRTSLRVRHKNLCCDLRLRAGSGASYCSE